MILEEFDKSKKAILNPDDLVNAVEGIPEVGITCFSKKLLERIINKYNAKPFTYSSHSDGELPIYKANYKGKEFCLFLSKVGAPACISQYENLFVMGIKKMVVFGTCGVLCNDIQDLSIIIPNSALRDEGTSYHYNESSREIKVNPKHIEKFIEILKNNNIPYIVGKTWTTDAPYRETTNKVKNRKEENCLCVDMECSAIAALAKFRKKEIFQFFYASDNLDSKKWEARSLRDNDGLTSKEKIGDLAFEIASLM